MYKHLYLISFIIVFLGCSKSKHERRISDGVWYVHEYLVNGADSTQMAIHPNIKGYKFEIESTKKSRRKNDSFDRIYAVSDDNKELDFGHWGERDGDKMMLLPEYAFIENLPTKPFIDCGCLPKYNINYIDKKEMKYTISHDGSIYELTFKKY